MEEPKDLLGFSSFLDKQGSSFLQVAQQLFEESPRVFVVKAEGIVDRTKAEALKGRELYVLKTQLPHLERDIFYHGDLVNLAVLAEDGTPLGKVIAVDNFGAGDLLEIAPQDTSKDSFWVPFRNTFVPEVSIEKGYVRVSLQAVKEFGPASGGEEPSE